MNRGFKLEEEVIVEQSLVAPEPAQKMLTQEQVNALIGREKKEAADRARKEVEARYMAELQQLKAQAPQQSMGGMTQPSMDEIYQQVEQRLMKKAQEHQQENARKAQEAEMQKVADDYFTKMSNGSEMFEDFNEVMSDFRPDAFPEVIHLVSGMDNTPQIMYELAKNPSKLATIYSLAKADPIQAKKALKKLSDSISMNEQAAEEYVATNAPLTKPKPSQVGTDKGLNSIKDYKNADWLRT